MGTARVHFIRWPFVGSGHIYNGPYFATSPGNGDTITWEQAEQLEPHLERKIRQTARRLKQRRPEARIRITARLKKRLRK